ncbi:hypothetical protein BH20ACT9_BH20ACT9_03160 [soil metagenome]
MANAIYCTHCGRENPPESNFCAHCGHALVGAGEATTGSLGADEIEEHVEVEVTPADVAGQEGVVVGDLEAGTALLVGVRGPNKGARFLLDRDLVTVGRHPDSDIFLDDITVSRRHAEFRRDAQRYWVHDVGSLNGTYINGVRAEDRLLSTGDEVQVGKFKLVAFVAEPSN